MYAIIDDGGHQYKVQEGQELEIDYRSVATGGEVKFDKVLAVGKGDKLALGTPAVSGASVTAEVVAVTQGPKLTVQNFRRRKNFRRRTGHRQMLTKVRITKITA